MTRSAWAFCHGDLGAVRTVWDVHSADGGRHVCKDRIAIVEEIPRRLVLRKGIPELLRRPSRCWMLGDRRAIFTNILDLCARVVAIQGGKGRSMNSESGSPRRFCPLYSWTARVPVLPPVASRRTSAPGPSSERRSAARRHAAALSDGHVSQDADRLASTRARRAAAARDVRSVGTPSPVPKYISSGVCPRNAECGRTRLCSST